VRYRFIQDNRNELPVKKMCQVLSVSRSGYYDWKSRQEHEPPARQKRRDELLGEIRKAHAAGRGLYGSPKVYEELKAKGVAVSENTVAKYMKMAGIRSKVHKRFVVHTTDSTHDHPVASNTLNRRFDVSEWPEPDLAWCTDITGIWTEREGWLYLAAVMDLCSRKIVGWAMADHLRAELCTDALGMALEQRRPNAGLLHHSDRGVQYACEAYQSLLEEQGIKCSMSRTGNCYDNAAMESFFATLKRELVYQERYDTHAQAKASIFEYVEGFYNRKRRHSSLGYQSPVEFEASLN
jgi:transposase InsO family protein